MMRYLVSAALLLCACDICDKRDAGRMYVDGKALYQPMLPIGINCDMDCRHAVDFWWPYTVQSDGYEVWIRYCDLPVGVYGATELVFLPHGAIMSTDICISPNMHQHWAEQYVIAHEIGHALGLAHDDSGCPSIMSPGALKRLQNCVVTSHDREILDDTL